MGTHCTVRVKDNKDDENNRVIIYRQFDGYYSGIGEEIKQKFQNHQIINGFNIQTMETHANGMGCFAAQLVEYLKDRIGNIYLLKEYESEEYDYIIYNINGTLYINVDEYDGPLNEFNTNMESGVIT